MELIVSTIGIVLCLRDRNRFRFFLIAFVFMFTRMVYLLIVTSKGGVMENLHVMGYDPMSGLFRVFIFWIPRVMNLGFYGFLLLGIKKLIFPSSNE